MYRLNEETKLKLIREAKNYESDQLELFKAELGWQDWMNVFTESEEGGEITESEAKEIDEVLDEVFRKCQVWFATMNSEDDCDWESGNRLISGVIDDLVSGKCHHVDIVDDIYKECIAEMTYDDEFICISDGANTRYFKPSDLVEAEFYVWNIM